MATKLINIHHKLPYDIYIGRGSIYGNPFSHLENTTAKYKVATREEAIEKYREWVKNQPQILENLHKLKDKVLGCYCREVPGRKIIPCHGDVLIELINELEDK
jgi:hypothetical protein